MGAEFRRKGELTSITDPLGNVTKLAFTAAGLISTVTDAQNNVTTFNYDQRGNRTDVYDALNNHASFTYDGRNRLTKITNPDNSAVSFTYDARGRRTSVTDGNGKMTQYAYDDADRLVRVTDANNHVTQYAYDMENNLTSITDANNNTTSFSYDAQGNLTQTTFPSTLVEKYSYDNVGNLVNKIDRKGQAIGYQYDNLNRLLSKSYPDSTSVNYSYDDASRLAVVQDASGTYSFEYDNMGRLKQTSSAYAFLSGNPFTVVYGYAASNRTSLTDPTDSTTRYTYDTLNRLANILDFNNNHFGFGYDALSRRAQMTRPNGISTNYAYDSVSNLLSVLHQQGANTLDGATYTYDSAGNRTNKTNLLNNTTSNFSYDNVYQLTGVTGPNPESYTYDAVGNRLTSQSVSNYAYNTSNELTIAGSASYTYDANGNTLTKTDSELRSGAISYYEQDGLGSVTSLSGSGGALANTYAYDSFGNALTSTVTIMDPYQYTGRDYDAETGLRYYRARYYDSSTRQFLSEDPIRFQGGINFYQYVQSNPLNWIDPSGNQTQKACYTLSLQGVSEQVPCVDEKRPVACLYVPGGMSCKRLVPSGLPPKPPDPKACRCDTYHLYEETMKLNHKFDNELDEIYTWMPCTSSGLKLLELVLEEFGAEAVAKWIPAVDAVVLLNDLRKAHNALEEYEEVMDKLYAPCIK